MLKFYEIPIITEITITIKEISNINKTLFFDWRANQRLDKRYSDSTLGKPITSKSHSSKILDH